MKKNALKKLSAAVALLSMAFAVSAVETAPAAQAPEQNTVQNAPAVKKTVSPDDYIQKCQASIDKMQKKLDAANSKGNTTLANALTACISAKQKYMECYKAVCTADNDCIAACQALGKISKDAPMCNGKNCCEPGAMNAKKKMQMSEKKVADLAKKAEKEGKTDLAACYKQIETCLQKKAECMKALQDANKATKDAAADLAKVQGQGKNKSKQPAQ